MTRPPASNSTAAAGSTIDLDRVGLRERKKRATRAALSEVALRLAVERGIDHVRVEDIAAEVGVSPRTFSNYFPSKEAAIAANAIDRAERVRDALQQRPSDEPLWQALSNAVISLFPGEPARDWIARTQLVRDEPSLAAEEQKSDKLVERMLIEEIAARTGTDAKLDLYPRLAATALLSAVHAAIDHWLASSTETTLESTLRRATSQIVVTPLPDRRS